MTRAAQPLPTDILVARHKALIDLSLHDISFLRLIEAKPRHSHRPECRILSEGAEVRAPHFIVSGWACRVRELADTRRQIMRLLLPGDMIGLSLQSRARAQTSVVALTPLKTVEAPEIPVAWRERARVPTLAAALDLVAAEDEHLLLCHALRLGRQTAYERTANLFCELEYRHSRLGLSREGNFAFPLTQDTLADVLGLSVVHVNRTLQQMRREGRINLAHGRLAVRDIEALRTAGEFVAPRL
jgi:CRP-like cAMP-binding protein